MELTLRIVLAVVLLAAAAAKLRDPRALTAAVADHGVPRPLRGAAAAALVAVEAALGALLLVEPAARAAGAGTAALGLVFAGSLGLMRARGRRRAPCGCFGGTRERPVALLAVRALLLAALGAVVASGVADRPAPSGGVLTAVALAALALAVVALAVLVLALYRQVGVLEARLGPRPALELEHEGPPLGGPAPAFDALRGRGAELVAFSSPGCRLCADLRPALEAVEREGIEVVRVDEHASPGVFADFRVPGTPYVVFAIDGVVVAKGLVNTLEQIEELISLGEERIGAVA
ncbi:thioredoxin family protein [Miltoncostaea marina]|uniref:thioredoxin family protein n=1 Tax=Miltoncostaea marina TaxID=2843215 RepID=UPI001C3D5A3C|nr:thioredoxin family protein [Miltoncostaea marina]